mmetsp:Transcript_9805/g.14332  ORF Transcript_9805/g.14332 Transcript_9805/m.14332 type:complete len:464 (+) Transcript_9805:42-1433(+)
MKSTKMSPSTKRNEVQENDIPHDMPNSQEDNEIERANDIDDNPQIPSPNSAPQKETNIHAKDLERSFPNVSFRKHEVRPALKDDGNSVASRSSTSSRRRSSFFSSSFIKKKRGNIVEFYKTRAARPLDQRALSERLFAIGAGVCLAFNSGYINGCCLSGLISESGSVMQAVSAFTGSYTRAGLALADGDASFFGFEASMIGAFIGGSCISALINPRPKPWQLGPTYGPTFIIGSILLAISSTLASTHPEDKSLFYFASAANGLQNGMTSMYSANLIRTSHLTGTSTDIGLIIGQMLRGNFANSFKLGVLVSLAVSFWLGALTSFYAVSKFRGFALIFNAAFFFLIGIGCVVFVILTNKITVWQAVTGKWHWSRALNALDVTQDALENDGACMGMFDRLDVDGDGFLEADELHLALKTSGMRVSKKGAKALIAMGDTDGDGKISRDEWFKLMRGQSSESFESNA